MFLPKMGVTFTLGKSEIFLNELLPETQSNSKYFLSFYLSEGSKNTHCRKEQYAVVSQESINLEVKENTKFSSYLSTLLHIHHLPKFHTTAATVFDINKMKRSTLAQVTLKIKLVS